MSLSAGRPALRGGLLSLLAAVLFGITTPLVQRFGAGMGAFSTAALLYGGAAVVGGLLLRAPAREARLARADLPRLLAMAAFGAVIGPVALAWGLQHTSGVSASLMLTLEAFFTAVLAWVHASGLPCCCCSLAEPRWFSTSRAAAKFACWVCWQYCSPPRLGAWTTHCRGHSRNGTPARW